MMNAATGRMMPRADHIAQSVRNILLTRLGTRVEREEYGSLLPDLIDMPMTPHTLMLCRAAVVDALARWEPRLVIRAVQLAAAPESARLIIRLAADDGRAPAATEMLELAL